MKHPPNRNSRFKQGYFKPVNPEKYAGDPTDIVYRSGLEKRYMMYFDTNPSILKWAVEEIVVPYVSPLDNAPHRYFPDFIVKLRDKNGQINTLMIEIKPSKEREKPVKGNKSNRKFMEEVAVYAVNQAKWKYAQNFCEKNNMQFVVLTEQEIKFSG